MVKNVQLLEEAKRLVPPPKYKVQQLADKFSLPNFDIKILFLPVSHPELNPMEMIWSYVKRKVGKNNLEFKLCEVEEFTRDACLLTITDK